MEEKKIFRVAVVGCGAISNNHIRGILAAGQKVVALCDVDPAAAKKKQAENDLTSAKIYTDYEDLLEREPLDAVHICTPHYLHAPMVVKALQKGIHVLCEKPLCISSEQLEEILTAEKNGKATLGVCLQNRYEPNMKRVKDLVKDGSGVRTAYGNVIWHRDEDYYRSGAWRGKWATEGGGVMINQALHTLDLLQWFCGMPKDVTAHIANDHLQGVIEVEDTATARFTYEDGKTVHFFATTASKTDFPVQVSLRMENKEFLTAENSWMICEGGEFAIPKRGENPGKREWGVGHRELIEDFYRCLADGEKFPIDGNEGGKVVRMILAMYRSDGKPTEI